MESHAQAYGVKRYGDTVRALKDQIAAKTGVAPARQRLWMGCLLLDDAATLAACGEGRRCTSRSSRPRRRRRRPRRRASPRPRPRCATRPLRARRAAGRRARARARGGAAARGPRARARPPPVAFAAPPARARGTAGAAAGRRGPRRGLPSRRGGAARSTRSSRVRRCARHRLRRAAMIAVTDGAFLRAGRHRHVRGLLGLALGLADGVRVAEARRRQRLQNAGVARDARPLA